MKYLIFLYSTIFFSSLHSQSVVINEIMTSNSTTIQDEDGNYPDWIEIYNPNDTLINLHLFSLSDDIADMGKWIFPYIKIHPKEYLIVFASGKDRVLGTLHTNFKIKASGEQIWLRDSLGQIIDHIDSVTVPTNISLGRNIDNLSEWLFYDNSTPGSANSTQGYTAVAESPQFSIAGGFYSGSQSITFSTNQNIYYTLDGSEPNKNSAKFSEPIALDATTVVRARRFRDSYLPSKIITHTYFINENFSLPVVSLSTNPANLWDDEIGIYVVGTNGIPGPCEGETANFYQDWERPLHIEFYEQNGSLGFSIDAGVKIHGGCTREFEQKSLAIIARNRYGFSTIPYKMFSNRPFENYKSIILRMSGNDHYHTFIKDASLQSIVEPLNIEHQAYRPSIVFLNGEYWGIHNIRERITEEYLAQYHLIDPNNIDLLKNNFTVVEGDSRHYLEMHEYFENNDISVDTNYNYVNTLMDIDNYISYMISEMYFVNLDWFPFNRKFFRPKNETGKWRWILFDTDLGFNLGDSTRYKMNMINYVIDSSKYPSEIIRGLLNNNIFERKFINTFADYANTIFKNEVVINNIDSLSYKIENEIPRHAAKWKHPTMYWWNIFIERLKTFGIKRIGAMQNNFLEHFDLDSIVTLNLDINIVESGFIKLNTLDVNNFPWSGEYFSSIPVKLTAKNKSGYKFSYWQNNNSIISNNKEIIINVNSNEVITAIFESVENLDQKIIINEINYNSSPSFDTEDWIELYNNSENIVDISNWIFKDGNDENAFYIPDSTTLQIDDYIVLCRDTSAFDSLFNIQEGIGGTNYIGNFDFKLSNNGELLRLYNASGELVDTVKYDNETPWPIEPNNNGSTLELLNPNLDNAKAENWGISTNHGSPGKQNDSNVVNIKKEIISPRNYHLKQNYPNPFNPTTTIQFGLPESSFVQLVVYNIIGEKIETLVDEELAAGLYKIKFDGTNLSSGIYLYRIKTEDFSQTRKLLIIR